MAKKSLARLKSLPAWAMVQYSMEDSLPARSKKTRARFMSKSATDQAITIHPKAKRKVDGSPVRKASRPKSSLKMQKGTPMVRAWNVGVKKNLSFAIFAWDMV